MPEPEPELDNYISKHKQRARRLTTNGERSPPDFFKFVFGLFFNSATNAQKMVKLLTSVPVPAVSVSVPAVSASPPGIPVPFLSMTVVS